MEELTEIPVTDLVGEEPADVILEPITFEEALAALESKQE